MPERQDPLLDAILWNLPYGPGLWHAIKEWPDREIQRLNTIVQFLEFKCQGDWVVYVETALPALGEVALVLLDFGWDDVVRGFLRPYGLRNRLKFRSGTKRKRRKSRFEIPELGELIGKSLPGAKIIKGRNIGRFQRWLWTIDAVAQRVLWYWMLIDLTSEFLYDWATGIMTSADCYQGADWGLLGTHDNFGTAAGAENIGLDALTYEVNYGNPPKGTGWEFLFKEPGQMFVSARAVFSAGDPGLKSYRLKAVRTNGHGEPIAVKKEGMWVDYIGSETVTSLTFRPSEPGWYAILMDTQGSGTAIFELTLGAYAGEKQ